MDLAVLVPDEFPGVRVRVLAQHGRLAFHHAREQRLGQPCALVPDARAHHFLAVFRRVHLARGPQHGGRLRAVRQRLAQGRIQQQRREPREVRFAFQRESERKRIQPKPWHLAIDLRDCFEHREPLRYRAHRDNEPTVDLRFGQCPLQRRQDRLAEVEIVFREVEVEECRLVLLELRRRGEHVMRHACGLRHRDVDHDEAFQFLERLAVGARVRAGQHGVPTVHHQPANPVLVVGVDLLRQHVRRVQLADLARPRHFRRQPARLWLLRVADERQERRVEHVRAFLAEVTGHEVEQSREVIVQRAVRRVFEAQIRPDAGLLRLRVAPRDLTHPRGIQSRLARVRIDRNRHQQRAHVVPAHATLSDELLVLKPFLHDRAQHREHQVRVAARPHLQENVRLLRRLRAQRIDHDQRAVRVLREILDQRTRLRHAVRLPRVRPDHEQVVRVVRVLGRVAVLLAEQLAVDPEPAGLLLRE